MGDMEFIKQGFEFFLALVDIQILAGFQNCHDVIRYGQFAEN